MNSIDMVLPATVAAGLAWLAWTLVTERIRARRQDARRVALAMAILTPDADALDAADWTLTAAAIAALPVTHSEDLR